MAFTLRAGFTDRGAITFTGNALGLSKEPGLNEAGRADSIGAFASLNLANQVPTFPAGTTLDWTLNGAAAVLDLPPDAVILHAELIWGGCSIAIGENVTASLDTQVTFNAPGGAMVMLSPDPLTSDSITNPSGIQFYMRSAEVTTFIQNNGPGTYSVEGVPATVSPTDDVNNVAGWTLAVIYRDPAQNVFRNMTLFLGMNDVSDGNTVDIPISGFGTPPSGAFGVRILSSTLEGDANKGGDTLQFGPNVGSLTSLMGPNNVVNNFFASQINRNNGTLDTRGTFGNRNQVPGLNGNIDGGRQGWDITNVNATGTLGNSQTNALTRFTTFAEGYNPFSLAVQIDVSAPIITMVKAGPATAELGSTFTYSVQILNTGSVSADNVIFTDLVPAGLTYVPGTFRVNNNLVAGDPNVGVPIGNIAPSGILNVTFDVFVEQQPVPVTVINNAAIDYTFISVVGGPTLPGDAVSNDVPTIITQIAAITIQKLASTSTVQLGETFTYTLVVTNETTGPINNILVVDVLPDNVEFIEGSVVIDGNPAPGQNPEIGINIVTLAGEQVVRIEFDVVVDSVTCPLSIVNQGSATYTRNAIERTELSNEVVTSIINSQFKQLIFNQIITIPEQNPSIEDILNQITSVEVKSTRLVKTNTSTSLENQSLTEYKLIIDGYLNYFVEYIADNCVQSIHTTEVKKPFSTFVILNGNFTRDTTFDITSFIEYERAEIISNRDIFMYVLLKIDVVERN